MKKKILCILTALAILIPVAIPVKVEAVTTAVSINTNKLTEVESLVGHYQFNIAAGGNINAHGDRGYSHVEEMASFEKDHSKKLLGNSSGGFLDGSTNTDGSIYKAYLVIETSTIDYSLPDYPITFVAGNTNKKLESKVEYYCFTETYSSGNERRSGYIDVTDFVKENGYGWYYVCNIPYTTDGADLPSDQFAGWKLIVIEENYDVPMRMLKLNLGCQNIMGAGQNSTITVSGEGIRTAMINDVTGQFLFGMAGADFHPSTQSNKIAYADVNNQDELKEGYKTFTTKSGIRTLLNPLAFMSARNGNPLQMKASFENPVYFDKKNYSSEHKNGSYLAGAGDLELLDINSSSEYYHDVKIGKGKNIVSFQFETVADCALMTSVLGIAVDIDVPEYKQTYDMTYADEKFTLEGSIENITELFNVGVVGAKFNVAHDKDMTVTNFEARLTSLLEDDSAKYEKKLTLDDITVDKNAGVVSFNVNGLLSREEESDKNVKNDTLFYKIEFSPTAVKEEYSTDMYITGNLYSSGKDTGLYLDKIAITNLKSGLDGIIIKKNFSGKIYWNDESNKEKKRPQTIEVSLCTDSVPVKTIPITGNGDIWEYSFDNLNIYKDLDYTYQYDTIIKKEYEGYEIQYDGSDVIFNLKEKYVPEETFSKEYINISASIACDGLLYGVDLSNIFNGYGIYRDINQQFKEAVIASE